MNDFFSSKELLIDGINKLESNLNSNLFYFPLARPNFSPLVHAITSNKSDFADVLKSNGAKLNLDSTAIRQFGYE